jgi:hypothetical protein
VAEIEDASAWGQLAVTAGVRLAAYNDETAALVCSECGHELATDGEYGWPAPVITFADLLMLVAGHLITHMPAPPATDRNTSP